MARKYGIRIEGTIYLSDTRKTLRNLPGADKLDFMGNIANPIETVDPVALENLSRAYKVVDLDAEPTPERPRWVRFHGLLFGLVETGGGCSAYEANEADGAHYQLLTQRDDVRNPEIGEPCMIGRYTQEGEQVTHASGETYLFVTFTPDAIIPTCACAHSGHRPRCHNAAAEPARICEYCEMQGCAAIAHRTPEEAGTHV